MTTISGLKWRDQDTLDRFREQMVALGGRWNNTYQSWMFDSPEAEVEAQAIRKATPDGKYVPPPRAW